MKKIQIKLTSATGNVISLNYDDGYMMADESKKTIVERLASLKNRSYNPQSRSANVIPYNDDAPAKVMRRPLRETAYYFDGGEWFLDYDYVVEYNRSGRVTREKQTAYYPDRSIKAAIDATYEINENGHPITETYAVSEDGREWRKWGLIKNIYDKKRTNAVLSRETYGWDEMTGSWRYIPSSYLYHLTQVLYDDAGRVSGNVLWYGSESDGIATDRITYVYGIGGCLKEIVWEFLTPNDIVKMVATDIEWLHHSGNFITYGNDIYDIFDDDIRNNAPLAYNVTEYDGSGNVMKRRGRVTYTYDERGRLVMKKTVTGEQRRIFVDRMEYDIDGNGSYSEEHVYACDNNDDGTIGCNEIEGYSKTDRFFDANGNIVLKNEYVLEDDVPFLDFGSCRTYSDSAPRLSFSTRHRYRYGSGMEILEEDIDVKPYDSCVFTPRSRHVYSDFTDIVKAGTSGVERMKSVPVTYRNESLFFDGSEGSAFTVVDMKDRIYMRGKTSHEVSVKNLSTGLYKVIINGQTVKFFKR